MKADLAGFFSRLKGRGNGPRLRRAKQNRTKKLPSCSRYLIKIFLQHYRCLIEPTNNKLKAICRFSLLLVLSFAPRGFSPGTPVFPSPQKGTFPNSYNPGQKSLGQYFNIHIFLSFLGSLLKQWILFEILLQFSLPPPYTKLKLGKNSGYTRPTLFVEWGEGLDLCELENAPETQKCPKTFVHNCSSKNSHFQNEAKSKKPFLWEWVSFAWE